MSTTRDALPIKSTDDASDFLVTWMRANFPTDRTFDRYILGAYQNKLAADFAWQLANALALQAEKLAKVEDMAEKRRLHSQEQERDLMEAWARRDTVLLALQRARQALADAVDGATLKTLEAEFRAIDVALAGATAAPVAPERASPVQQRKALEIAHLFVQVGVGFVPMPVANEAEFDRLANITIAQLGELAKAAGQTEGGAA